MRYFIYSVSLILMIYSSLSITAQSFDYGTLGTYIDKNSRYHTVENLLKGNDCNAIWKLCSKEFKKKNDKKDFCNSVENIANLFKAVKNNRLNSSRSGLVNQTTYFVEYFLLPRKWFGRLSHDNYNDQIEIKLRVEFSEEENDFYLNKLEYTNDYLNREFDIKKYVKDIFNNSDSLLLDVWFPSGYSAKELYNDTSSFFVSYSNKIKETFNTGKIDIIKDICFFPDSILTVCLGFNEKVKDRKEVKNSFENLINPEPSVVYLPKFELVFALCEDAEIAFISNGQKYSAIRITGLNKLQTMFLVDSRMKCK
ncbi:MAG: hypothetical protein P1P88_19905 [Bacteroidales bacterium]|nr:hypothetical protein [Bacteroidales bacterium]